jgi:hypothetical protein
LTFGKLYTIRNTKIDHSPVAQSVEQMAVRKSVSRKGDARRYADRREYLILAVQKRRRTIRMRAVEYKGGRCEFCGYNRCIEALEFHDVHSNLKDFSVSGSGCTRSWKKVREVLDKCIMLRANCHREIHAGMQLPQETAVEESGEFRKA